MVEKTIVELSLPMFPLTICKLFWFFFHFLYYFFPWGRVSTMLILEISLEANLALIVFCSFSVIGCLSKTCLPGINGFFRIVKQTTISDQPIVTETKWSGGDNKCPLNFPFYPTVNLIFIQLFKFNLFFPSPHISSLSVKIKLKRENINRWKKVWMVSF